MNNSFLLLALSFDRVQEDGNVSYYLTHSCSFCCCSLYHVSFIYTPAASVPISGFSFISLSLGSEKGGKVFVGLYKCIEIFSCFFFFLFSPFPLFPSSVGVVVLSFFFPASPSTSQVSLFTITALILFFNTRPTSSPSSFSFSSSYSCFASLFASSSFIASSSYSCFSISSFPSSSPLVFFRLSGTPHFYNPGLRVQEEKGLVRLPGRFWSSWWHTWSFPVFSSVCSVLYLMPSWFYHLLWLPGLRCFYFSELVVKVIFSSGCKHDNWKGSGISFVAVSSISLLIYLFI